MCYQLIYPQTHFSMFVLSLHAVEFLVVKKVQSQISLITGKVSSVVKHLLNMQERYTWFNSWQYRLLTTHECDTVYCKKWMHFI